MGVARTGGEVTPTQFRTALHRLGYSAGASQRDRTTSLQAACELFRSPYTGCPIERRTLNRWLAGRHPIPHWVANRLAQLTPGGPEPAPTGPPRPQTLKQVPNHA